MKSQAKANNNSKSANGFIPNSLKFISSCIKTASSGVRTASASVAASISGDAQDQKDQVLWACFDKLELGPSSFKNVLLLGYTSGFQVLDVEDASSVSEIVSRRDDPVTFLQMQPLPSMSGGQEGFRASHPLLLVVASDESNGSTPNLSGRDGSIRDGYLESHTGNLALSPTAVRFYSLRSHSYVHVLRFRSTVYMVRCSPLVVAVGLATQIYCFDALTLESKFSVLTYPVPQLGSQGTPGVNIGYGPMALGSRWLAYASNNPLLSNTGRLSPQSLTPPGVSPSTSPGSGSLVARYAMESSKQLAAGLINLGDIGYKTLSKYCQELVPDGSGSPVSSNSSWKVGRLAPHSPETDVAGMVVVKDIVSRAVVSQFRAHTSPISALCFDPSGTLLVTASIHGNNINIFRIMPSSSHSGSGSQNFDWSSSHVHLYKLHRGMTSAVIQDICFSHYSQWVAIVSSRGTCHIFVLSPFGGENVIQIHNSDVDGPTLLPVSSPPWWSTPSFVTNLRCFLPPPPNTVTLSVVSRLKNSNSGWLNTVSNAASSAAGKVLVPSGAVSAVFHSSVSSDTPTAYSKGKSLENLLVYTPSGHVIQYKLLPSLAGEQSENVSRPGPTSTMHMQDEELRVKVEPVQWWDVCRRTAWPEREECISGITRNRREASEMETDVSCGENEFGNKEIPKPPENSHLYLANSEVQIDSGRIPIWQKSQVSFYTMGLPGAKEQNFVEDHDGGEIEIERIPVNEVEIKRKDLLPIFDHFQRIQTDWNDKGLVGIRYPSINSESHGAEERSEGTAVSHPKLESASSVDDSDGVSSRVRYPTIFEYASDNGKERGRSIYATPLLKETSLKKDASLDFSGKSPSSVSPVNSNITDSLSTLTSASLSTDRTILKEVQSSNCTGGSEGSNVSSNRSDMSMNIVDEGPVHDSLDFEPFFQEEYCKPTDPGNCHELTEAVTDADCGSGPCDREKSEEDADHDDMLGCVFAFSEEG